MTTFLFYSQEFCKKRHVSNLSHHLFMKEEVSEFEQEDKVAQDLEPNQVLKLI